MHREVHAEQEEPEGGLWNRIKNRFAPEDEEYEEQRETTPVKGMPRQTFRIASARESSITVIPVANFADIQRAADRLKSGEAQVINLEKAPPEVSERLIDFLNGVTYALDGYVEKVAEGAYLFTPAHISIHAEGAEPPQPRPFFDR